MTPKILKSILGILTTLLLLMTTLHVQASSFEGKKILFINSYHDGYPWSDGITNGVKRTLADTGVNLKIVWMDTKRNTDETFITEAAQRVRKEIETFRPDVVIAADDNASKHVIQPFFKDADLPFVFCGVNWDASIYGFPYKNVTGMVEVAGAKELIEILRDLAKGQKIAMLANDTYTARKDMENYRDKLGIDISLKLVDSMTAWKETYKAIQDQFDMLIIGNVAAIKDFNEQEAEAFAIENAKIPSGAVQMGAMRFAMIGYLKVPEEQGDWAAQTALKIISGTSPAEIPIINNTRGTVIINAKIALSADIEIPYKIVESAEQIIE